MASLVWPAVYAAAGRASIAWADVRHDVARIDLLLATLNATDLGSLDSDRGEDAPGPGGPRALGEAELAGAAAGAVAALRRGDVAEFKRGRAFLQSKIGHLR